jgi:HSP20 family molecular chaperone IbpA
MPLLPGRAGGTPTRPGPPGSRPAPLAEFAELHDAYVAEVELPGVPTNQMRIELVGRDLVISTQSGSTRSRPRAPRRARRAVRLECRLPLPGQADTRQVMAALADGLLIITVPRQDTAGDPAGGAAQQPQPRLIVYPGT